MNRHKGSVLLLTLSLMTSAVVLVLAYLSMIKHDIILMNSQSNAVHAFYVAEAGLNKAIWYLLNTAPDATTSGSWRTSAYPSSSGPNPADPQEEFFEGGSYTLWVQDSGSDILVTARGVYHGATRVVRQKIHMVFTPHALRYSIFSGGDIGLDNTSGTINGSTASRGSTFTVSGLTVNGTINEYTVVNAPMVSVSQYESMADTVINGDQVFASGNYTGIWYVDGNVTLASNVTVTGSIIATGSIDFAGQSDIHLTSASSNPVLISSADILADNSSAINISGLVYAAGEAAVSNASDFVVNGAIIAGSGIMAKNNTNFSFTYDPQIFSSPPPFFTDNTSSRTITAVPGTWGMN